MASRAVSAPLAQLPNALTVLRLALIPLFVVVYVQSDGSSWAAGWIFLVAGVTDQLDGFLARRWHVESRFGKLADPLADRLMLDAAAILLWLDDKLPWYGALIIVLRDVILVGGYRLLMPTGRRTVREHARQGGNLGALPVARDPARRRTKHRMAALALLGRAWDGARRRARNTS